MINIIVTNEYAEDSYTNISIDIEANGEIVGCASLMVDGDGAYCDRIDIFDGHRNKGYGTAALLELSDMYDGIMVAPDNADAQRLYERIGRESCYENAEYIDQGYGVYAI